MYKFIAVISLFIIPLITGCASSAKITPISINEPIAIPLDKKSKPLLFKKIVVKLKRGEDIGAIQGGLLCVAQSELIWLGGKVTVSGDEFTDVFKDELVKANYDVVGDPNALFDDPSEWKAEYLIAGLVNEMQANLCYPWSGFGNWSSGKGEAYMKVNWQIYSRLERKVIKEFTTEGSNKVTDAGPTGPIDVFLNAFAVATQNLIAEKGFNDLVLGNTTMVKNQSFSSIKISKLNNYNNPINNNIDNIRSSVITIFAGDGHGSGFYISNDGYILTNAHVVGGAKFVKIKLLTGREILGEVLRKNDKRDIALIKAEESFSAGIPIDTKPVNIGEEVYAVGSPLDERFSTTLSKGIVSNYYNDSGINYIQSDVNVQPGSSGGPLLDSNGNLIGLTVSGIIIGRSTTGLNFFIPINEALNILNVTL